MIDWYTCAKTGKHAYYNRKDARTVRQQMRDGSGSLSIYRCTEEGGCGDFHIGRLAPGESRAYIRNRREADEARNRRIRGES